MNEPQTNENETPDCSEMVAVLREAYDWLNNDKTLWESQSAFNTLMDKIERVLGASR